MAHNGNAKTAGVDIEMPNDDFDAPGTPPPKSGIANPAPLGLLAFGMTTFFLMSVDALWSGKVFVGAVMGYAYAYGGVAQMVAGIFEVRRRGAAGACAGDSPAK